MAGKVTNERWVSQVQRHKARAEAAEKERDLHAEVGWEEVASGKWQVAWFVNTNTGGVGKPPTGGKRPLEFVLRFITANICQLISTQPFPSFLPTWQLWFSPKKSL